MVTWTSYHQLVFCPCTLLDYEGCHSRGVSDYISYMDPRIYSRLSTIGAYLEVAAAVIAVAVVAVMVTVHITAAVDAATNPSRADDDSSTLSRLMPTENGVVSCDSDGQEQHSATVLGAKVGAYIVHFIA